MPKLPFKQARLDNSYTAAQPTVTYPTMPVPAHEDAFVMLARFDTALVVDDSGSMAVDWGAT
jgi:hypothetical protein